MPSTERAEPSMEVTEKERKAFKQWWFTKWGRSADIDEEAWNAWEARASLSSQEMPEALSEEQKDAARYRWLRDESNDTSSLITEGWEDAPVLLKGTELDAAIERAVIAQKGEGEKA